MSEKKKTVKMLAEDKAEMEKMRRFKVKIYGIVVLPLQTDCDPFVQFTVGGDFSLRVIKTKDGKTVKKSSGERGYTNKTEVIEYVKTNSKATFDSTFEFEARMTYSMVNCQSLMVELWDYNGFWMNKLVSYATIPLIEIVNGNCNVAMDLLEIGSSSRSSLLNRTYGID